MPLLPHLQGDGSEEHSTRFFSRRFLVGWCSRCLGGDQLNSSLFIDFSSFSLLHFDFLRIVSPKTSQTQLLVWDLALKRRRCRWRFTREMQTSASVAGHSQLEEGVSWSGFSFIWFEWESLLPPMWGWRWDWGASLMKALSPTWPAGVRVCGVVVWRV